MDTGQFICEKDLMKNFKAAGALQRELICESLCSLCCPERFWGGEEEPLPCSYCQVYHMWVSQDINIPRQLEALEQAVFRWSAPVWPPLANLGETLSVFSLLKVQLAPGSQPLMVSSDLGCPQTKPPGSLLKVSGSFTITKMTLSHLPIISYLDSRWHKILHSYDNGQ